MHVDTPKPRAVITRFIVPFVFIVIFAFLAYMVHQNNTLSLDEQALRAVNSISAPFWDYFFVVSTELGGVAALVVIGVGMFTLFALRHQWKRAVLVAMALGGAALLNVVLKLLFERPRPDLWEQLVVEDSFSFPSGHAMASMALALVVGYLVLQTGWQKRAKGLMVVALCVYVVIVGLSRVYLGVHYPSDIIAGWILSAGWVALIIPIVNRYVRA